MVDVDYQTERELFEYLARIADALERLAPPPVVKPATEFFPPSSVDPVDYIMETYGETKENAELIVKNCTSTGQAEDSTFEEPEWAKTMKPRWN